MQTLRTRTMALLPILLVVGAIGVAALADDKQAGGRGDLPPPILGEWSWYRGVMRVSADGSCHWQGGGREEHGKWQKATGYLFDWGEKGNDWNYLNVDSEGRLSGRFINWGGDLQGVRPESGQK